MHEALELVSTRIKFHSSEGDATRGHLRALQAKPFRRVISTSYYRHVRYEGCEIGRDTRPRSLLGIGHGQGKDILAIRAASALNIETHRQLKLLAPRLFRCAASDLRVRMPCMHAL